jgi:hypothetical protein
MPDERHEVTQNIGLRLWDVVEEALDVHGVQPRQAISLLRLIADDLEAGLVRAERPAGKPVLVAVPRTMP